MSDANFREITSVINLVNTYYVPGSGLSTSHPIFFIAAWEKELTSPFKILKTHIERITATNLTLLLISPLQLKAVAWYNIPSPRTPFSSNCFLN